MSRRTAIQRILATATLSLAGLFGTGCELFDLADGVENSALHVYAEHEARVYQEDGRPAPFDRNGFRVLQNDEGWEVTLRYAYVTTAAVSIERCDNGETTEVEMYWGRLSEDLRDEEKQRKGVGGTEVSPGQYCKLTVTYAPYEKSDVLEPHPEPEVAEARGATAYFEGVALKGDQVVPFKFIRTAPVVASIDIDLEVADREAFPVDVTITKVYDGFFEGIDFAELSHLDHQRVVADALMVETEAMLEADL